MVHDVVGRLPGRDSTRALLLVAHYDSVPTAAGAADNGSGVAALLETARALRSGRRRGTTSSSSSRTVRSAACLGRRRFLRDDPWAYATGVVLNFDSPGSSSPALMYETSPGNGRLISHYRPPPAPTLRPSCTRCRGVSRWSATFARFVVTGIPGMTFGMLDGPAYDHTAYDSCPRSTRRDCSTRATPPWLWRGAWGTPTCGGSTHPTSSTSTPSGTSRSSTRGRGAGPSSRPGRCSSSPPRRRLPPPSAHDPRRRVGGARHGSDARRIRCSPWRSSGRCTARAYEARVWTQHRGRHERRLPARPRAARGGRRPGASTRVCCGGCASGTSPLSALGWWAAGAVGVSLAFPARQLPAHVAARRRIARPRRRRLVDRPDGGRPAAALVALAGAVPGLVLMSSATYLLLMSAGLKQSVTVVGRLAARRPPHAAARRRSLRTFRSWLPAALAVAGVVVLFAVGSSVAFDSEHPKFTSVLLPRGPGRRPLGAGRRPSTPTRVSSSARSPEPSPCPRTSRRWVADAERARPELRAAAAGLRLLSDVTEGDRRTVRLRLRGRGAAVLSLVEHTVVGQPQRERRRSPARRS